MLAKAHKLDLRKDPTFLRTAYRVNMDEYSLFSKKNDSKLLFQVTIGKGTVKTAVERNALRRSVYDICAEFLPLYSSTKLSIVVLVRNKNIVQRTAELRSSIEKEIQNVT